MELDRENACFATVSEVAVMVAVAKPIGTATWLAVEDDDMVLPIRRTVAPLSVPLAAYNNRALPPLELMLYERLTLLSSIVMPVYVPVMEITWISVLLVVIVMAQFVNVRPQLEQPPWNCPPTMLTPVNVEVLNVRVVLVRKAVEEKVKIALDAEMNELESNVIDPPEIALPHNAAQPEMVLDDPTEIVGKL